MNNSQNMVRTTRNPADVLFAIGITVTALAFLSQGLTAAQSLWAAMLFVFTAVALGFLGAFVYAMSRA